VDGRRVDTPPKELELLYHLAASPNRVFTRNQLLDEVWGFDYFGDSRTVDVHIKRLREKLENISDRWALKTVWGVDTSLRLPPEACVPAPAAYAEGRQEREPFMKSMYKRQFLLMAGMVLISFALLGTAFMILSYRIPSTKAGIHGAERFLYFRIYQRGPDAGHGHTLGQFPGLRFFGGHDLGHPYHPV
jgi:hypothetical protein